MQADSSWHGRLGASHWQEPTCVTTFGVAARDYCDQKIMAHEYLDDEATLQAKVDVLAGLCRRAQSMVAFTGAGISTAAGIDDYASKAKESSVTAAGKPVVKDWKQARPTKAHRVLAALHGAGFLKHWIQQNHDSLPQKAGYPQAALNEIHGSLHDPANPIVPYEGHLRDDLYTWMCEWQTRADLVLALGTSLSGFNVDSIAETAARKQADGEGLGLVIINIQQTPFDNVCSLRLFAKLDDVMERLAIALQVADQVRATDEPYTWRVPADVLLAEDVFRVPFDATSGDPLAHGAAEDPTQWMTLNLCVGQHVRLTGGTYEGDIGQVKEKAADGSYRIRFEDSIHPTFNVKRRPFSLWLGSWWLYEAAHGHGIVPGGKLPLVNDTPMAVHAVGGVHPRGGQGGE
jgi:NAD-dependent SIR2 family protein deacetylase